MTRKRTTQSRQGELPEQDEQNERSGSEGERHLRRRLLARPAGGAGEEDHTLGITRHVVKALDHLSLTPSLRRGGGHGGPHTGIELAAEGGDQLGLLRRHLKVTLGQQHLTMAGLETQELHDAIMANRRAPRKV